MCVVLEAVVREVRLTFQRFFETVRGRVDAEGTVAVVVAALS